MFNYTNRELSWLSFNERVIELAKDKSIPFNERFNYLSISGSNLDEFYMVRVAGLKQLLKSKINELSIDSLTPGEQLNLISIKSQELVKYQENALLDLTAELNNYGYTINNLKDLDSSEIVWLEQYFEDQILPIITPTTIDASHPIPFIFNLELFLVFKLKSKKNEFYYSFIKKPHGLERFILIPKTKRLISFEKLISYYSNEIYNGFKVLEFGAFRIIRDSDLSFEEEAEDLLVNFNKLLNKRRKGDIVRIDALAENSKILDKYIKDQMNADSAEIFKFDKILGFNEIDEIQKLIRIKRKYKEFNPRLPERIDEFGGDYFSAISSKDFVIHHPYESFNTVVKFLLQASKDKNVISIKQTLYRTSNNSPIIAALMQAAFNGKSVTALIELKARFDEKKNIQWAKNLEKAGVQVVYGLPNLKIHAKISLVTRKEEKRNVTYCHFGTGNYHPITAQTYTDLSLFTKDKDLTNDAAKVFSYMTSYVKPRQLSKLSVSPDGIRKEFYRLIDIEIQNSKKGIASGIWAKCNSLVDSGIINKLYEASQAGVNIVLVVRGICCLQPGIKGLSENIKVKSIVGRFLEHSRIYCFSNGRKLPSPDAKVFISSADWMKRNLDRRIEVLVPIENKTVHKQVLNQIMVANILDNENSWLLCNDSKYRKFSKINENFSCMDYFIKNPSLSGRGKKKGVTMLNLEKNKKSVLFVCIHNSARSQMAEAFLKTLSKDFIVNSAGISPGKLNPLVVKSMMEIGIDISNNKTKSVESVLKKKQKYDYFIFVCSESQGQECPYIPYQTKKIYWDINDPSKLKGADNQIIKKISVIRDEIKNKIYDFISTYETL